MGIKMNFKTVAAQIKNNEIELVSSQHGVEYYKPIDAESSAIIAVSDKYELAVETNFYDMAYMGYRYHDAAYTVINGKLISG